MRASTCITIRKGSAVAVTDAEGNEVERFTYSEYGELEAWWNPVWDPTQGSYGAASGVSLVGLPYFYTGQRFDFETGLHYYKNRYYDSQIGRFLRRDLLGYADGPNLYEYAKSNPVTSRDPLGLQTLEWQERNRALFSHGQRTNCMSISVQWKSCEKLMRHLEMKANDGSEKSDIEWRQIKELLRAVRGQETGSWNTLSSLVTAPAGGPSRGANRLDDSDSDDSDDSDDGEVIGIDHEDHVRVRAKAPSPWFGYVWEGGLTLCGFWEPCDYFQGGVDFLINGPQLYHTAAVWPGLPMRLAKNVARGGTYVLKHGDDIMRTGRTNDLARRAAEHARAPATSDFTFEAVHYTDDLATQKGLEQMLHDQFNPPLDMINPVSPTNPNRELYIQAAEDFLSGGDMP